MREHCPLILGPKLLPQARSRAPAFSNIEQYHHCDDRNHGNGDDNYPRVHPIKIHSNLHKTRVVRDIIFHDIDLTGNIRELQVLTPSALESWSLLIVFLEIGATARDSDDSRDKEHSEALAKPSLNSRKVSASAQHPLSK
jgi:hypothetical protein